MHRRARCRRRWSQILSIGASEMFSSCRLSPVFGALLALLATVNVARAETGAAEALFRAGRDAAKQGDHAVACAKFAESERLEPAVGTELNLALCEEQLQHLLVAWRLFRLVIDKLPEGDTRLALARRHFSELDARVPRVTLKATGLPPGTQIRQGNTRLSYSSLGVAIPVDLGEVEFVVTAPGRLDRSYRIVLAERARETLFIEPGHIVRRKAVAPADATARGPVSLRTFGVLGMGLGAALISVGGVAGLAVLNAKDTVERECDAGGACSAGGVAAAERGQTFSVVSTVSFAAGVGCAGLGAWFWLQSRTPESANSRARLGFALGPGQAWVHGRF